MHRCLTEAVVIVEFEFVVKMNLVQIGTNEFYPNSFVCSETKGTYSPARTATRNWGDAIKAQCPLSSSVLHAAILSHRYSLWRPPRTA
jgi:hypothetical protein